MSFLNPFILWVLPAAMVPVLLHLLNRRPPKRLPFSYIGWLKQAHRVTMPKKRLQEILLMVVRTLLLLFLVFFFARPILHTGNFFDASASNDSMVVLLDVSASVSAVEGGREALDWTKERLQAALRKLPLSMKIGLVVFSDQIEMELAPTDERSRLTTAIQNAKGTQRGTDAAPALKLAAGMLSNQPKGRKTLLVVSDLARHGWLGFIRDNHPAPGVGPDMRVVLWDAVGKVPNAGVSDAGLELSEEGVLKGQSRFHLSAGDNVTPSWILHLNNRVVAQGRWRGPVEEPITALSAQLPEGGFYSGRLDLTPDAAAFDDVYYIAGRVPKGFRLLLVDGESGLAPADSETYYLRSALESPRDPRVESINVMRPEMAARQPLASYDAIVLANVAGFGDGGAKEAELLKWVEEGGGLFLTAGSKWPAPPSVPLRVFRSSKVNKETVPLAAPDTKDPFLAGVNGLSDFQWDQISVSQYVALENESASVPLLKLKNGDTLLTRKQLGKGFVLCLATSLDRSWTNFPAKPVFAPLMREMIAALADPLREQTALQGFVGRPVRLRVPSGVKSVSVVAPDGVASGANVNREGVMEWPAPSRPGLYQVKTDRRETDFAFAVNIPDLAQEGDLARLSEKEARKIFPDSPLDYVSGGSDKTQALLNALQGKDLTNSLLFGLFLLFAAETLLAFAWKRRAVPVFALCLIGLLAAPARAGSGNNFVYAQLKYDGAWDPYPNVHERIFQMVHSMTNIPFIPERKVVTLDSPALFDSPFLIIKGNAAFKVAPEQKTKLKEFIDRGGFVFIDDTLGDPQGPFAASIRHLMAELYPDRVFQKLPIDHALFRSFFLLRNVAGRRISEKFLEGLDVSSNANVDTGGEGRTAVVYCPNDLLGAWVKDNLGQYSFSCEPGGEAQRWESFKLTINMIYFSLTGTYKKDAIHQPFIEMKLWVMKKTTAIVIMACRRPGMSQSRAHFTGENGSWIKDFQDDDFYKQAVL